MPNTYTYLAAFEGAEGKTRSIWSQDSPITRVDIVSKENELSKKYGTTYMAIFLTLLGTETSSEESEESFAKYIVKNLDTGERFFYDFRSEAIEKFEELVREHGEWQEIELSVRVRHHSPREVPS